MRRHPHVGKPLLWVLCLLVSAPVVALLAFGHPGSAVHSLTAQLRSLDQYVGQGRNDSKLIRLENVNRQGAFPIRVGGVSSASKLKLQYVHVKNVSVVAIEIPRCRNCEEVIRHENRVIDHQEGSFFFGLEDSDADHITVRLHGFSSTRPIEIGVSALEIIDKNAVDDNSFFVVLMLGVAASLIIVGAVCGTPLRALLNENTQGNEGVFLILGVFAFTMPMIPALLVLQAVSEPPPGWQLLAAVLAAVVCLVLISRRLGASISSFLDPIGHVVVFYLAASVVIAAILAAVNGIALQEYHWSIIGKFRMFEGHRAHDNAFQYLNGLAVAENKPFSYFYRTNPLVKGLFYGVEDRQMLSGPMFAVYRVIWGLFSPYVVNTYAFFTIFGTCLTMLIFFPIYGFFSRIFDKKVVMLSLLVLTLTTYVLGNLYYTWFKILAGAMVLSGVFFLYYQPSKSTSWVLAGVLWGIAANVHAGQVVVYPLLLAFFFIRQIELREPATLLRYSVLAAMLTGIVVGSLLPWEVIKAHYYPGDLKLFREHILGGERYTGSISDTIWSFLQRYTLEEQLAKRSQQLLFALRIQEVKTLLGAVRDLGLHNALIEWNRLQYRYIVIMAYPLVVMLLTAWMAGRFSDHGFTRRSEAVRRTEDAWTVFFLAVACIVWGLLLFYTKYEADSSSFVSSFAMIVVNTFLVAYLATYSKLGLLMVVAYALVGLYKAALYFNVVLGCVPDHTFSCERFWG